MERFFGTKQNQNKGAPEPTLDDGLKQKEQYEKQRDRMYEQQQNIKKMGFSSNPGDEEDNQMGQNSGGDTGSGDGYTLNETQKLQLAERANKIFREQLKYMQDHLASLRSLIQDKENIIENLVLRYDLGIITMDTSKNGNVGADEIDQNELRRKAKALAWRSILENFELRELINEQRDEMAHLRKEIDKPVDDAKQEEPQTMNRKKRAHSAQRPPPMRRSKSHNAHDDADTKHSNVVLMPLRRLQAEDKARLEEMEQIVDGLKEELDEEKRRNQSMQQRLVQHEEERKESEMEVAALKAEIKRLKLQSLDTSKFEEWGHDEIAEWILGLGDGKLAQYADELRERLKEEQMEGSGLKDVDAGDLKLWGFTKFADRKYVQRQIEELVNNQAAVTAIPLKANEGAHAPTAFL